MVRQALVRLSRMVDTLMSAGIERPMVVKAEAIGWVLRVLQLQKKTLFDIYRKLKEISTVIWPVPSMAAADPSAFVVKSI